METKNIIFPTSSKLHRAMSVQPKQLAPTGKLQLPCYGDDIISQDDLLHDCYSACYP